MRLAVVLGLLTLTATAALARPNMEVTLTGGYRLEGAFPNTRVDANQNEQSFRLEAGGQYGFMIDLKAHHEWDFGLSWDRQQTRLKNDRQSGTADLLDLKLDYYLFNVTRVFGRDSWRPFAGGGLGVGHLNPAGDDNGNIRISWQVFGGGRYYLSQHIGVRAMARLHSTYTPQANDYFCQVGACSSASGGWMWQGDGLLGISYIF